MSPDEPLFEAEQQAVLDFLADPASYPGHPASVEIIETHMSRVFLAGARVYKLKKPIRLSFVDFTGLEARRRNCEREFALNQQLAPGVYLEVVPLNCGNEGVISFGGTGQTVEWLLVMRRLNRDRLLDHALRRGAATPSDIARLCDLLAAFYARAPRIECEPETLIEWWRESIGLAERSLTDTAFHLPQAEVARVVRALWDFLARDSQCLPARLAGRHIVDGHGDLRPEHVWLGPRPLVIDRLEFDDRLRWGDPFDEAGFLGLECEMLGAPWVGRALIHRLARLLNDAPPERLLRFYRCYRAALRARLSIEHLRDPAPRTPRRWPRRARAYLDIACASLPDQS